MYTLVDVDYDQHADTELMERTMQTIMADDEDMVRFMQKLMGYTITGEVREETFTVFSGNGRNGKGQVSQLLEKMLGRFFVSMDAALITERKVQNEPAELGKLLGSRVAYFKELQPDEKLRTSQVQLLSGGDPIAVTPKYADPMNITPYHKYTLETNHMPVLSDMLCVHFPVTFTDLEPDEAPQPFRRQIDCTLKDRLAADYVSVLAWLVQGAVAWYACGGLKKNAPAKVTEFSREYFKDQDKLSQFLSECCEVNAGKRTETGEFLDAYNDWADREGVPVSDAKTKAKAMLLKGFVKRHIAPAPGLAKINCYDGIVVVVRYGGRDGRDVRSRLDLSRARVGKPSCPQYYFQ